MKKILSLLVLLVTTLSAFALDFTDYRKVTLGYNTPTESNDAKLSVTDNGDGTYNVTFNDIITVDGTYTDNYGTFTFSNVSGSTSGDVTTVTATDVTGTVSGGDYRITEFTKGNLSLKFKDGKAYATMTATCNVFYSNYTFDVVFGTDKGFGGGSTGGGETGGEDKPAIVDVVEADYAPNGTAFGFPFTINWDTQKLVAKLDLSTCSRYTHNEGIITVGTNNGSGDISLWNPNAGEANCHLYYTHYYYGTDEKQLNLHYLEKPSDKVVRVDNSLQNLEPGLVVFTFDKEGLHVGDNLIATPDQMSTLYNSTSLIFGSKEGSTRSNATYKYVKVVSLDWKETTEPEVTVKEEKTFNEALYMQDQKVADATVVVKEMSDETINMSLKFGENEYTSTELTKGTDTKGRTTYTGKVANGDQTYDVAGVVYEKDNVARLYMTLTTSITTVVVGENPDAVTPEVTEVSNKTYTSNLRILDGETTVVEEAEANVNIVKYSDESYKVTLKNVNMLNKTQDLVFVGKALIEEAPTEATEPLTIIAKSDEATTTVFGEQVSGTFEITEVSADEIKMGFSMESQNFSYQGEFNYTEEEEPEVYTNNLHIYDAAAPETDLFQADQAKVEFLATETGEFKLTLKDVTLNEKTQDLVFTGALPTPQPGGQDPLAEEGEGEVTPAEPAMVLNATADDATTRFFDVATYPRAVFNVSYDKNDNFMMTFTIVAGAKNYGGEFNYEKKNPDTPDPELFCKENYVADGTGFEWDINVDWDTQKIVMSIDPSTCTGSCEDVIGLGAVPTAWDNTLHLYRTSADQMLQGYFNVPGGSNNNTDKFAETAPFLVEVSKAQGFVVNNEVKIAASAMSYLFTLPTVKMGTGEGANDKSRATYNYVKVVDKDWTAPKDPDTGINATTVAEGEVEFFTVNGVKLNKLQKGLNIVRTADGKVKKVLVK